MSNISETYEGFCNSCIHKNKVGPSPCDSCYQEIPTNFTEEDDDEEENISIF